MGGSVRFELKEDCSAAAGDLDVPMVGLKLSYGLASGGDMRVEIDGRRFMICEGRSCGSRALGDC